jgi:hypothetical protein
MRLPRSAERISGTMVSEIPEVVERTMLIEISGVVERTMLIEMPGVVERTRPHQQAALCYASRFAG